MLNNICNKQGGAYAAKTENHRKDDSGYSFFHCPHGRGRKLTVRRIAEKPGCSTQPVLYHFRSVEEIRSAVYEMADVYHSSFLKEIQEDCDHPLLSIGLHYMRFAVKETELFRFFSDVYGPVFRYNESGYET